MLSDRFLLFSFSLTVAKNLAITENMGILRMLLVYIQILFLFHFMDELDVNIHENARCRSVTSLRGVGREGERVPAVEI